MNESKVIALDKPEEDERDALTEFLRQGAWRMLAQTEEAEVEAGTKPCTRLIHIRGVHRRMWERRVSRKLPLTRVLPPWCSSR